MERRRQENPPLRNEVLKQKDVWCPAETTADTWTRIKPSYWTRTKTRIKASYWITEDHIWVVPPASVLARSRVLGRFQILVQVLEPGYRSWSRVQSLVQSLGPGFRSWSRVPTLGQGSDPGPGSWAGFRSRSRVQPRARVQILVQDLGPGSEPGPGFRKGRNGFYG